MPEQQAKSDLRTSERVEEQAKRLAEALVKGCSTNEMHGFPREFSASGDGKGGGGMGGAIDP